MKRSEIRTFLNDGVEAVNSAMPFGSGQISEWNSNRSNTYPGVWWQSDEPVSVEITPPNQLPTNTWKIKLWIGKKDALDSSAVQYEALVDDCDYIAQQLIRQYSQVLTGQQYNLVTVEGINREPFFKKNADLITGVILTFDLSLPDTTNLC